MKHTILAVVIASLLSGCAIVVKKEYYKDEPTKGQSNEKPDSKRTDNI